MEGAFETVGSIAFEIAYYLIMFLEYAMLARAILSWFLDEESRILARDQGNLKKLDDKEAAL